MSSAHPDLLVAPCSYQAAKYAVEKWHYSRSMPTSPLVMFGVWEDASFVGAVLFGRGSNNNGHKPYGIKQTEFCELVRVALRKHSNNVSKIVAICIKQLAKQSPGLRLIVSYADMNQEHVGTIYQAGNWIYTGKTGSDFRAVDANGRVWHSRQVSSTGVLRQYGQLRAVPKLDDCEIVPILPKHRYLYPLDRAMRKQIAPLAQPYPKKDTRPVKGDILTASERDWFDPMSGALENPSDGAP